MMKSNLVLAGGCFWCVEHDMRHAVGVIDVDSGYASSVEQNVVPSYENHSGFREAVRVQYDPGQTSFKKLVQFFLDHIDPTDEGGQFADRGESYKSAIYFNSAEEHQIAQGLLVELDGAHLYDQPIVTDILPMNAFYPAEEYHQNYADKNSFHYSMYRQGSGREDFVSRTCQIREEKNMKWSN